MRIRALAWVAGGGILLWALVVRGSLAPDLGVGRRYRRLGPLAFRIAAPREVVFDVASGPYLGRTPRALSRKLEVLERGEDVVLAAHYTRAYGLTATTVETVRFEPPDRVHFRLVRGPVPHVLETFELRELDGETELEYAGELGTTSGFSGRCGAQLSHGRGKRPLRHRSKPSARSRAQGRVTLKVRLPA